MTSFPSNRGRRELALAGALLLIWACRGCPVAVPLPLRQAKAGQVGVVLVPLRAGAYLRAVAEQHGIDLTLAVSGPGGELLAAGDGPSDWRGNESALVQAPRTGRYRVEVRARTPGSYRLTWEELPARTAAERRRIAAERAVTAAAELYARGTAEAWREALRHYERALAAWQDLGEPRERARILFYLGTLHGDLGQIEEGKRLLAQALAAWRAVGDRHAEAEALNQLGYLHWLQGENGPAASRYRLALALRRAVGDGCAQAQSLSNLGLIEHHQGAPGRALHLYARALSLCGGGRRADLEARLLVNVGGAHEVRGELREALGSYAAALPMLRRRGLGQVEAVTLNNMGAVHRTLGELQAALDHYRRALAIFRRLGDPRGQATTLNSLGLAYLSLGEPLPALRRLNEAVALRRQVGDPRGEAATLNNLGLAAQRLGNASAALDHYRAALALRRDAGDRRGEGTTLGHLGALYRQRGELAAALPVLRRAVALHRQVEAPDREAHALCELGQVQLALGEARPGRESLARALSLFQRVQDPLGEAETLAALAAERRRAGDLAGALARCERALDRLEAVRAQILSPDLRATFLAQRRRAFEEAVDLHMALHRREPARGHDRDAFRVSERGRARTLLELLAEAEIRRRSPAAGALSRPPTLNGSLSAESLESLLAPGTLLLHYALGEERSFLWAVGPGGTESFGLPPRRRIEEGVRALHGQWSTLDARGQEAEAHRAAAVSRLLLGPIAPRLGDVERLFVVADGALHYLPFAALPVPRGRAPSERLLDRCEVVHLPSASVLAAQRRAAGHRLRASHAVAVLADALYSRADPRLPPGVRSAVGEASAWPRLPWSGREAEALAALVPAGDLFLALGERASLATVRSGALRDYRIVHFGTHGLLAGREPRESGLLLSLFDAAGRRREGLLSLGEVAGLGLQADLVVLSGCGTALGREVGGEGLVGLTRAFFHAGAAQVVASLWQVEDAATAELMQRFYGALLRQGRSPAAALREAQRSLAGTALYRDPYYWAGFVLQGEGS